jgi:hypothetical protein
LQVLCWIDSGLGVHPMSKLRCHISISQMFPARLGDRLYLGVRRQRREDRSNVVPDGRFGDAELSCDDLRRNAVCQKAQDFLLPRRQKLGGGLRSVLSSTGPLRQSSPSRSSPAFTFTSRGLPRGAMHARESQEHEDDTGDEGEHDRDAAVSSVPGEVGDADPDHG